MVEKRRFCKKCGIEINKDDKRYLCNECRAARNGLFKNVLGLGFLSVLAGSIYLILKASDNNADPTPTSDIESEPEHALGEKYWNEKTQNWEKDGKPYKYRVKYKDVRDGETHVHDYTDVDDGYEDYEHYLTQWYTSGTKWDHIPPEDD